ncbi:hypothetical protein [Bradyrhizobium sp. BR 10261]|uniref:hypothetical protein n=1 Tax=Bradyrhizobium sp. BR 10261 TaxID=2749992 RepID=UPI001C654483|nr:hypothetical protein [Bradyrhizobium sp. BR 10261]MBW7965346.1 hypothetical protein [Bradyrhizobium sp. BR 10261]
MDRVILFDAKLWSASGQERRFDGWPLLLVYSDKLTIEDAAQTSHSGQQATSFDHLVGVEHRQDFHLQRVGGPEIYGKIEQQKARPRTNGGKSQTLKIGDVTITSLIERDGPWRKPEEMFPAYDPVIGRRHLADLDPLCV